MAILIDGKLVAQSLRDEIAQKTSQIVQSGDRVPCLVAVLVGDDGGSETYVAAKMKACQEVGFSSRLLRLPNTATQSEVLDIVDQLNNDDAVDGFIVQLPLPKHVDVPSVIERVDPAKDVDGFHPLNVGRMAKGLPALKPATPSGILKLLQYYKIPTRGAHVVVVGRSGIVGSPVSILLSQKGYPGDATVTLCHSYTKDLEIICRSADILIAATGIPGMIKAHMVKPGAVIIDVGTTRVADGSKKSGYRLSGDVDFVNVEPLCSYITPVPGGVGPMTIASLLSNTLQAAIARRGLTIST